MELVAQSDHQHVGSLEADHRAQRCTSYGTACFNCVKSKTRCATSTRGGKCERCQRLKKDCQPAPTVRKSRVSKRRLSPTPGRTAVLEGKLDSIVQMLQHSQGPIPGMNLSPHQIQIQNDDSRNVANRPLIASAHGGINGISHRGSNLQGNFDYEGIPIADNPSLITCDLSAEFTRQQGLKDNLQFGQSRTISRSPDGPPTPATSTTSHSAMQRGIKSSSDYPLETQAELEECLETYRNKMVPYFPIVCMDAEITVEELKKQRPFLHLVIRAICSKNLWRQAALVLEVKKVLGREMILEGEKSLDLFLGILVFTTWSHLYICNKPIISTIIQLGMSLAFDLGFTRPLSGEPVNPMLNCIAQGRPKPVNATTVVRTMEERRATVGLYLLNSVSANYFRRIEIMRWTPYLEECLRLLEEEKDFPTDDLLVYLVRVQLICNKAVDPIWNDVSSSPEIFIPAGFYVKLLTSQLNDLERRITLGLRSNVTLQLHILGTTLSIHEYSFTTTPKLNSFDSAAQLQRIESLWICLKTVKAWFNSFFSLEAFPLFCYPHISMAILAQLAHCLVALYCLSTFSASDIPWDRQNVRRELDLGDIVKLIADRWERVPPAAGIEMGAQPVGGREDNQLLKDPWSDTKEKVLKIGRWWEAKVAAMTAVDVERNEGLRADGNRVANECEIPGQQKLGPLEFGATDIDTLDDTWLTDLFGGGYDFNLGPHF